MSDDADETEHVDLGPCCICEKRDRTVRNLIMLSRRNAEPGFGWGCLVCGLPMEGAYAVLCDDCMPAFELDNTILTMACRGNPAKGERVPIAELPPEKFDHDNSKHMEDFDAFD